MTPPNLSPVLPRGASRFQVPGGRSFPVSSSWLQGELSGRMNPGKVHDTGQDSCLSLGIITRKPKHFSSFLIAKIKKKKTPQIQQPKTIPLNVPGPRSHFQCCSEEAAYRQLWGPVPGDSPGMSRNHPGLYPSTWDNQGLTSQEDHQDCF